jgi:uncharacterized protein
MTCATCGAPLPDRGETCPTCGAGQPATVGGGAMGPGAPPPGSPPPGSPPPGSPPGAGPTHPSGLPNETRNWALGAHLSVFVGSLFGFPFAGPLVVWLIRKDVDEFSARHAREALNFNLTLLLVMVVGGVAAVPLTLLTVGLILIPFAFAAAAIGVVWIVLTIVAAVKANEGQDYRYPLTIRFVR